MIIDAYLTYIRCELNLSASTVLCYEKAIKDWAEFASGGNPENFDPTDITVSDLRLWISSLASGGASPRTLRLKSQALRSFYRYLARRHNARSNPAAELQLAKLDKPLPAFVRQNEVTRLTEEYTPDSGSEYIVVRNRLIITLLYQTGMRVSELVGLTDAATDTFKGELKVLGKRNKERIIPFGESLKEQIENYRKIRASLPTKDPNLFLRPDGSPLTRNIIYRIVRSAMEQTGVSSTKKSPHVLRHTFATHMVDNGADLTAVQKILGHTSLATTQIYTHTSFRELRDTYMKAHPRAAGKTPADPEDEKKR
jgi:integrase/recombinase XerC